MHRMRRFRDGDHAEFSLRRVDQLEKHKYCCVYMLNFSPGAERKFPWECLLRWENTVDAHARVPFSVRDEKNDSDHMDFSARLTGQKILVRFENQYRARTFSPGWIAPLAESLSM